MLDLILRISIHYKVLFFLLVALPDCFAGTIIPDSISREVKHDGDPRDKINYLLDKIPLYIDKHTEIAIALADTAATLTQPNSEELANCFLKKAEVYHEIQNYKESNKYAEKAYFIFKTLKNETGIHDATFYRLGLILNPQQFDSASIQLQSLLPFYRKQRDYRMRGNIYFELGRLYSGIKSDSTLYYFNNAITHFQLDSNNRSIAKCKMEMARYYHGKQRYYLSIKLTRQSIIMFDDEESWRYSRASRMQLGEMYRAMHDTAGALMHFRNANNYAVMMADTQFRSVNLVQIGNCFAALGNLEIAIQHFLQNLDLQRKSGNIRGEVSALLDISNVNCQYNEIDSARSYLDKVNTFAADSSLQVHIHLVEARLAVKENNPGKADSNFTKAIQMAYSLNDQKMVSALCMERIKMDEAGQLSVTDKSSTNALLGMGLAAARAELIKDDEAYFHSRLYKSLFGEGNVAAAFVHLEAHHHIVDSIQSDRYHQRESTMWVNFEIDRYNLQKALNEEKKLAEDARNRTKRNIRWFMFSGVLILLLAGFIMYYKKMNN